MKNSLSFNRKKNAVSSNIANLALDSSVNDLTRHIDLIWLRSVSVCMHAWCREVLCSADIDYHKWRLIKISDLWSVCCKHVDGHTAVILKYVIPVFLEHSQCSHLLPYVWTRPVQLVKIENIFFSRGLKGQENPQ